MATALNVGELKARAALARLADVGPALRAVSTEAAVLDWLAQRAAADVRRARTATAHRLELLAWLRAIKAGEDPGPLWTFDVGAGRRALKTWRGSRVAAAAALTGEDRAAFANAQREGSRRPRRR